MLKFAGTFAGNFPGLQGQQIIFIKQTRWQAPLSLLWHCCFRNLQVQMLRKGWSFVHWDQYPLLVSHCVKITVNMSSFYDPVAWVYMCNCVCTFIFPLNFNKTIAVKHNFRMVAVKKSHPLSVYSQLINSVNIHQAVGVSDENWARVPCQKKSQFPQGRIDQIVEMKKKWKIAWFLGPSFHRYFQEYIFYCRTQPIAPNRLSSTKN